MNKGAWEGGIVTVTKIVLGFLLLQASVSCEVYALQWKIKRAFFNHWLECLGQGQEEGKREIELLL